MDFKVAGTRQGITAIQMDVKGDGLNAERLAEAFEQSRKARNHILDMMNETIAEPRPELAPHAPRVYQLQIDPEKIGDVIGPGGKTIKKLEADFDVKIDIEQDGRIFVAATDQPSGQKAVKIIQDITRELQVGEVYLGRVVRIVPFGALHRTDAGPRRTPAHFAGVEGPDRTGRRRAEPGRRTGSARHRN